MSVSSTDMTKPNGVADGLADEPHTASWKTLVPSWLLSACVHALIAVLMIWFVRPQTSGGVGDSDDDFRNVGLFVVPAEQETNDETEVSTEEETTLEAPTTSSLLSDSKLPDEIPTLSDVPPIDLPEVKEPTRILGPGQVGSPLASSPDTANDQLYRPNGQPANSAGSPSANASATVKFFGAEGQGSRFVYVIDSSSSMAEFGAMRMAKAQLMASMSQIDHNQEFQIVFYNTEHRSLTVRNDPPRMMPATAINRTLARTFIDAVQPNGGTNHLPAIELALSFKPDVIFLLTDAGEPMLYEADLQKIKRLNRGRATIHTVEFGSGAQLQTNDPLADNFLQKLARQNNGSYVYRNVREFQR